MRAARLHDVGDLRIEDVAQPPPPAGDQVLIRVDAAGICGSDLHNFRTGQWMSRKPSTPGHEVTGEVVAVGDTVSGLAPGDRVVADSRFWCGTCDACRDGRPNLCAALGYVGEVCDGGFAEFLALPARLVLKLGHAIEPSIAAMAEPLAVALHAIARLAPPDGEPVLIAGCGPIGGLAALVLARRGGRVLVADCNARRLARVAEVTGATGIELSAGAVQRALGRRPLRRAIEATGNDLALKSLVDAVSNGATLVLVGIFHRQITLDPNHVVERELALVGCSAFADELPEAIALLPDLAEDMRRLIDREIALNELPAAYRRLLTGEADGLKTIVRRFG